MRRSVLTVLPLLFLACSEDSAPQTAAIKVLITYDASFQKGCVQVRAEDPAGQELETERIKVAGRSSPLTVAVLEQEGWGDQLRLVVTAHEKEDCSGPAVDRKEAQLNLGRKGLHEDAEELTLSTPDGDGDGYVAMRDGGGGTDCDDTQAARFPGNTEVCDEVDNNCDAELAVDEGFNKEWYRDGDGDGALDQASRSFFCTPPDNRYVRRNSQEFDCDDADAERTPGRSEVCDNKDNNCNGGVDETFPMKGASCMNDVCGGTRVCTADKMSTVCNAPAPVTWHPDADGDGEGAAGTAGTKYCPPNMGPAGTAANATDCDDADRIVRAGLAETCDAVDNDCDGQVDEGASCGGTLTRVVDPALGGTSHDWRVVAVGPGGLPVWIAGLNGKLAVRTVAGGAFQSHSFGDSPANTTNCGDTDWYAAWVRQSDRHVFLAGQGGRMAEHTGSACINQVDAPGTGDVTGMVGFESGGVTTLYAVTTEGRLFTWVPGSSLEEPDNADYVYNGIHGLSADLLLVAGRSAGGNQRVFSYDNRNLATETMHTMSNLVVGGFMNSVWMGAANLAYAVGDSGYVWRWDGGTGWTLLPRPPNVTDNLYGVVTLPNGDAYTVDSSNSGQIHRRTPQGWATRGPKLPAAQANKPLYGIAMSSAQDFWVVGDDGLVFHYPEPPRP
jgi:hypothetical protein